ncbi:MAG: MOSC N-terminal beta barrel domain-containing protein, partial [Bacteroidota bacterium]
MALRLDEIRIYPIKSLPGIRVSHARVLQKGLEFDRRFMLIDRDNRFMTQ